MQISVQCAVAAPLEFVFAVLLDRDQWVQALRGRNTVQLLTSQEYGVGTRYEVARGLNGQRLKFQMEIVSVADNRSIRYHLNPQGSEWELAFAVRPHGADCELLMVAEPYQPGCLGGLVLRLFRSQIRAFLQHDLDSLQRYCERQYQQQISDISKPS